MSLVMLCSLRIWVSTPFFSLNARLELLHIGQLNRLKVIACFSWWSKSASVMACSTRGCSCFIWVRVPDFGGGCVSSSSSLKSMISMSLEFSGFPGNASGSILTEIVLWLLQIKFVIFSFSSSKFSVLIVISSALDPKKHRNYTLVLNYWKYLKSFKNVQFDIFRLKQYLYNSGLKLFSISSIKKCFKSCLVLCIWNLLFPIQVV